MCGALSVGLLSPACDGFPRDPERTTARVDRTRIVRAGLTESPPWVTRRDGQPGGIEVTLIEALARSRGARVAWHWGQLDGLLGALEHYELDVVIGGIIDDSPWIDRVGFTEPWHTTEWAVGIARGAQVPPGIDDLQVAVEPGTPAAAALRRQGARPVRTRSWRNHQGAIAAPRAYLAQHHMAIVLADLCQTKHVIAVPPGENQWLGALEETLRRARSTLARQIDEASR